MDEKGTFCLLAEEGVGAAGASARLAWLAGWWPEPTDWFDIVRVGAGRALQIIFLYIHIFHCIATNTSYLLQYFKKATKRH